MNPKENEAEHAPKEDEAEHDPKDEADHPLNEKHKGEAVEAAQEQLAATEDNTKVFDNQEMEILEQEINTDFTNPEFVRLLNDPEFMEKFDGICGSAFGGFQPPAAYTLDDFKQDMLFHFVRALPQYRGEAALTTMLHSDSA